MCKLFKHLDFSNRDGCFFFSATTLIGFHFWTTVLYGPQNTVLPNKYDPIFFSKILIQFHCLIKCFIATAGLQLNGTNEFCQFSPTIPCPSPSPERYWYVLDIIRIFTFYLIKRRLVITFVICILIL